MSKFGYPFLFLSANSFDNHTNQSFSCVFVIAVPKTDGFANLLLKIDGFGRTHRTRLTTSLSTQSIILLAQKILMEFVQKEMHCFKFSLSKSKFILFRRPGGDTVPALSSYNSFLRTESPLQTFKELKESLFSFTQITSSCQDIGKEFCSLQELTIKKSIRKVIFIRLT